MNIKQKMTALTAGFAFVTQILTPPVVDAQAMSNLDLSSQAKSVTSTRDGQITVGTHTQSVSKNDLLTPAESVALYQATHGGQRLVLSASGSAVGGNLNFTNNWHPGGNIVIPTGVTVVDRAATLNLTGNLTNSGTIYAVPNAATASISAANIFNQSGALISSNPAASTGLSTLVPVNLALTALTNIVNAGRIISAANLTMTAGGSITNALPAGITGAQPVMQALGNINFILGAGSQTAQIINSGLINSIAGNINFSTQNAASMIVNNLGGTLTAPLGAINVRDSLFTGKYDFNLTGGDVLSKQLNIFSGTGTALVDVGNITGVINVDAGAVHITATAPDLRLGTMNLKGDPTFYNTAGNVQIDNAIATNGNDLAIIASGDITSTVNGSINTTTTSPFSAAGGNALIIAGASIQPVSAQPATVTTSSQNPGDTGTAFTVTGGSTTGGKIDLSNLQMFSTAGGGGSGGNVTLVAFAGTGTGSGTVNTSGISFSQATTSTPAASTTVSNATPVTGQQLQVGYTQNFGVGQTVTISGTTAGGAATEKQVIGAVSVNTLPGNVTTLPLTAGTTTIPLTATTNLAPGETVLVTGVTATGLQSEQVVIAPGGVSAGTSITTTTGLVNTYTAQPTVQTLTVTTNLGLANSYTAAPTVSGTTLNVASTSGFGVGQTVTVSGTTASGSASELQVITAVSPGASITVGTLANTYTANPTVVAAGIQTGGKGGTNGNVTIIAGATSGTGISSGDINAGGVGSAAGLAGQISMITATPVISSPLSITNGTVTAGGILASTSGTPLGAHIATGNLTTNAAPITIVAGQNVSLGGVITTGGIPVTGLPAGAAGGNLAVFAGLSITTSTTNAGINTSGGFNSNGGTVLLVSGAQLTQAFSQTFGVTDALNFTASVTGASSTGGNIDLTGGGTNNMSSFTTVGQSVGAGFGGGNVQLIAFEGTGIGLGGAIITPIGLTINSGGTANGNSPSANQNSNGNVTILAGSSKGTSISIGNIDTTGSNAGGGNITIATTAATGGLPVAYQNGVISSGSFPFNSVSSVIQAASITTGNLSAQGGSLLLPPPANGLNTALTTTITVVAGQALTVGSVTNSNNTLPAGNPLAGGCGPNCFGIPSSLITINAAGLLTFSPGAIISSNASPFNPVTNQGVNGGTINITAGSFSGSVNINANGTNGYQSAYGSGGNGGSISITSTAAVNSTIQIGNGTPSIGNSFYISAISDAGAGNAGNGGIVTISSGSNIVMDPTQLVANPQPGTNLQFSPPGAQLNLVNSGHGAILTLTAATTLYISGPLDASGAQSTLNAGSGYPGGDGGTINITVNSPTPFNIGAASLNGNGTTGALTATGSAIQAGATAAFGSGGTIIINNLNTTATSGIIVGSGNLSVQAADATGSALGVGNAVYPAGNGGTVQLIGMTVLSSGSLDASGGASNVTQSSGNGGSITIQTNSSATFAISSSFPGVAASGNGVVGSITALGNVAGSAATGAAPTNLSNTGNGGTINLTNSGSGGIFIDVAAAATVSVAAANANATLKTPAGNGGSITLNAPSGPVLSLQTLDASGGLASSSTATDAGNGGSLSITTNSGTAQFTIGSSLTAPSALPLTSATNAGVLGLTANGYSAGSISVTNAGTAGIAVTNTATALTVTATANANSSVAGGNGGYITLSATSGPLSILGNLDVSGSSGATAGTGSNFAGSAGAITLVSTSAQSFTVNSQATAPVNGVAGTLTANGGYGIAGNGNAGAISITNSGGGININAANLSIAAPAATGSGYAGNGGALTISAPTGAVQINGALHADGGLASSSFAAGLAGSITIVGNSNTTFDVGGASVTQLTANGWNGGNISVTNNGSGGIAVEPNALLVTASPANPNATNLLQLGNRALGGPGGNITLQAPSAPVTLNGSLDTSGGAVFAQLATSSPVSGSNVVISGFTSTTGFAAGQTVLISNPGVTQTATSTPASGSNVVISGLASTTGFAPGQTVIISGITSGGIFKSETQVIAASGVSANSITVSTLNNTYTSPPTVTFAGTQENAVIAAGGVTANSITVNNLANTYLLPPVVAAQSVVVPATNATLAGYSQVATTSVTAGSSVAIPVPATQGYFAGQTVLLLDPGTQQLATTGTLPLNAGSNVTISGLTSTVGFAPGQTISITGTTASGGKTENEVIAPGGVTANSITVTTLTNSYTVNPITVAYAGTSETAVISPGGVTASAITVNTVANNYFLPPTVSVGNSVLQMSSTAGYIVGQPVAVGTGAAAEVQFVTSVQPGYITTGALTNNQPVNAPVREFTPGGTVTIIAGGSVMQTQPVGAITNVISANALSVTNPLSSVGTVTTPVQVNILSNVLPGTLAVQATTANINNISTAVSVGPIVAKLGFQLVSNGNISVDSPVTSGGTTGFLNASTTSGDIAINSNVTSSGPLLFQNNNLAGSINVADNTAISGGGLAFSSGPVPQVPVPGTPPPGVTAAGSFNVYFGNGLTVASPLTINATGSNVTFNGSTAATISLGNGVSLTGSTPVSAPAPIFVPPIFSGPGSASFFGPGLTILTLPLNLLGLFAPVPNATIVSTDQTPQADSEVQEQLAGQMGSANALQTLALAGSVTNVNQPKLFGYLLLPNSRNLANTSEDDSIIDLASGNGLLFADKDTTIHTSFGDVSIKAGSAVLILQSGSALAVLNLHDDHRGAVSVNVSGTRVVIAPGRQVVVTAQEASSFDDINPSAIGYRNVSNHQVGKKKVFLTEFSPISALHSILSWLAVSAQERQAISERLLKTAAAIYVLSQGQVHTPYKASH